MRRPAAARTRLAPLAGGAVDRARLAVVPRLRSRAPRVPFVMLVSLVLLGGVVGLLLFNTSMQQASFTVTERENEAAVLAARQQALETELALLRNPATIAENACRIGMVMPPTAAVIDLATGKVTGTPTAAPAGACPGQATR